MVWCGVVWCGVAERASPVLRTEISREAAKATRNAAAEQQQKQQQQQGGGGTYSARH